MSHHRAHAQKMVALARLVGGILLLTFFSYSIFHHVFPLPQLLLGPPAPPYLEDGSFGPLTCKSHVSHLHRPGWRLAERRSRRHDQDLHVRGFTYSNTYSGLRYLALLCDL